MTRYTVTVRTTAGFLVQHVVKADDRASAIARAEAAHPGGVCIECKRLPEYSEDDA